MLIDNGVNFAVHLNRAVLYFEDGDYTNALVDLNVLQNAQGLNEDPWFEEGSCWPNTRYLTLSFMDAGFCMQWRCVGTGQAISRVLWPTTRGYFTPTRSFLMRC